MDDKKIQIIKVYKDKEPVPNAQITEEISKDSDLELNPAIKNTNFFENDETADFLFDKTK
jgi:hypothetical protein